MKKRLTLTLATLLVSLMSLYGTSTTDGLCQRLAGHIEHLASRDLMGRKAGTEGAQAAAEYVAGQFASLGLTPFEGEEYLTSFGRGDLRNVVGRIEGEVTDTYIIIGAHYDHLGTNRRGEVFYGADDNASGVAALIECARMVAESGRKPRHTLLFVAFDAEEEGLLGSTHLAERISAQNIKAMVNLDMVGRLEGGALTVEGVGTIAGCKELSVALATRHSLPIATEDFERYDTTTDTEPFAKRSIPTLALTTGRHGDYHRTTDTPEKIDLRGLERVTLFVANLLHEVDSNEELLPTHKVARKHRAATDIFEAGFAVGLGNSSLLYSTTTPSATAWCVGLSAQYTFTHLALRSGISYDQRQGLALTGGEEGYVYRAHNITLPLDVMFKTAGHYYAFATIGGWVTLPLGVESSHPHSDIAHKALPCVEWGAGWSLGCRIGALSIEAQRRYALTPTLLPNAYGRTTHCILGVYF